MRNFSKMLIATVLLFSGLVLTSCDKDEEDGKSTMMVKLKDAPGDYEEVNVEVTEVQIHSSGSGWITIPVKDSIYDLLLLRDSANATLGISTMPSRKITQIRLILGSHNSVKVAGVVFPLTLSSEDETGLKLNVNQNLAPNKFYVLVVDLDADASVFQDGNGTYHLKPVMSAKFQ